MADKNTKAGYLEALQQKAAEIEDIRSHGMKRMLVNGAKLFIVLAVATGAGAAVTSIQESNAAEAFQSSGNLPYEFMYADGMFTKWNAESIGNDMNTLLTGGKILIRDGMHVTGAAADPDSGFLVLPGASYLNKVGNIIVYRDDKDRHIYTINPSTKLKTVLYAGNSGEVLCTKDSVYFIDYDSGSNVLKMPLDGSSDKSAVVDTEVSSFAVCGDTVLYIDSLHNLNSQELGSKSRKTLMTQVERFYLNGDIIAESQNKVVSFRPNGNTAHKLYESLDKEMRLASMVGDTLFIEAGGSFLAVHAGKSETLDAPQGTMYSSIAKDDAGNYYGICYAADADSKTVMRLVKIGGVE